MVSTHAVYTPSGGGGGRANKNILCRCCIVAPGWPERQLTDVHNAAADVPADQVCVHGLKRIRGQCVPGQDAVSEAGSEAFNLIFNSRSHIFFRSIWNVTIGPRSVLVCGSPRGIKKAGLDEEHKRLISVLAGAYRGFRCRDFIE